MSVGLAAFGLQPAASGLEGHRELTMELTINQMLMLAMQLQPRMTPKCSRAVCSQHSVGSYMLQGLQWVAAINFMSARGSCKCLGTGTQGQLTGRLVERHIQDLHCGLSRSWNIQAAKQTAHQ